MQQVEQNPGHGQEFSCRIQLHHNKIEPGGLLGSRFRPTPSICMHFFKRSLNLAWIPERPTPDQQCHCSPPLAHLSPRSCWSEVEQLGGTWIDFDDHHDHHDFNQASKQASKQAIKQTINHSFIQSINQSNK